MKNNNLKKGFTLIELLVVISIISVLSGVVLQSLSSTRAKSRDAVRLQSIESIAKGLQVATTGTNGNQFPTSGAVYRCLGISSGNCWASSYTPLPVTEANILASGISGAVPLDPLYVGAQNGSAYLYHSNISVGGVVGAYLFWRMEGTSCGRGVSTAVPDGASCALYLGPPTP